MNSLERYRATVERKPVDHLPRIPILMQFAAEFIGHGYDTYPADHRVLVEGNLQCMQAFGFDQVSTISDPYRETEGFGAKIVYRADGTPQCESWPLAEALDPDRLPTPDPMTSVRMRDRIDAVRLFKQKVGGQASILGWIEGPAAEAADLRGVSNFMMDLLDDQTRSADLMDRCVQTGIDFAKAQIQAGAETIGIGDAVASQMSPDVYERLIQPREKRMIDAIHEAGALVRLHICGNITHLLAGLGALGVDILDVDHMVDMKAVRDAVGGKVTISGNIDPVAGVMRSTPQSIREAMRRTYATVGNPYMVNAGCEIPPGTPHENLKALCEPIAWRN